MKLERILNLKGLLDKKSFFLFGPRAVGKTYLVKETFPESKIYNLLDPVVLTDITRNPKLIEQQQDDWNKLIVIDEIQKYPSILNEVHRLIEEHQARFLLTGSSAKKLRSAGVNLLAGRAWEANLFPLVWNELPHQDLDLFLLKGGMPTVVLSEEPWEELRAYTATYLEQEIRAEAYVKNLGQFVTFLDIVSTKVSEELNYQSIANDLGVSPPTVSNYFQLLEDTLIGFRLYPYAKTKIRKATSRPKFYTFDLGVSSALLGRRELPRMSDAYGKAFEHFIALELRAYLSYRRREEKLTFWRSQSGMEVDFIVGDSLAIETKAAKTVPNRSLKGLEALAEEDLVERMIVVSQETHKRKVGKIAILPWQEFLDLLWSDKLLPKKI